MARSRKEHQFGMVYVVLLVHATILVVCCAALDQYHPFPSQFQRNKLNQNVETKRESESFRTRTKREACTCNQKGTLYGLCYPLPGHNYKCICKRGYSGEFCNQCSKFSYGYPDCKSCKCNVFGANSFKCDDITGQCDCKHKTGGRICDRCIAGYFRFPVCQDCNCLENNTIPNVCHPITGACLCKSNYSGDNCEQCATGYFGFPECKACSCNTVGSTSLDCKATTGQCPCKKKFTGLKCDQCVNKEMVGPECDDFVKHTLVNETGRGFDERNVTNIKETELLEEGTRNNETQETTKEKKYFCDNEYTCQPGGSHIASTCDDLFYNDTESRLSACVPCGCFGEGTLASLLKCDKSNGKCPCKNHVQGQSCDTCKDGYYDYGHGKFFGCTACQCDIGASLGAKCDDYGRCQCRKNIEGKKCDKLRKGSYFLPSPYQLKFELEDGNRDDGSHVAYGYSRVIFPGFSWKGYVPFGHDQVNVNLKVAVPQKSKYKVAVRFVLASEQPSNALVTLRRLQNAKVLQEYRENFSFEADKNSLFRPSYSTSRGLSSILLAAGEWDLRVSSTSPVLYLDHVSLVPEAYYNPNQVLIPFPKPCHIDAFPSETCSMYEYLNANHQGFHHFKGNRGFVRETQGTAEAVIFDDPDMVRLLKLKSLAMISANQVSVFFNVSVNISGDYNILVEYFNADPRVYRIELIVDQRNDGNHWLASTCSFKFLCRSLVLTSRNVESVFQFSNTKVTTVLLTGTVEGMIGIHRLIAVPVKRYTNDYLHPKFSCIARNNKCLMHPKHPDLSGAIKMLSTKEKYMFNTTLPSSTWWAVIVQYKQPNYPKFTVKASLSSNGERSHIYLAIDHCPSNMGCRAKASFYGNVGTLEVLIRRPAKRNIFIEKVYIQRDALFDNYAIDPTHFDMSAQYTASCLDKNSLPHVKNVQPFCERVLFSQISELNDGGSSCQCNPRGSRSKKCEKAGGQCNCGPNIVGRRCQSCRAGYYGFPYCRNCQCFTIGSKTPECNRNGQCSCKPRYGGSKCNKCKSALFYDFPECKPCECDPHGSLGQFCGAKTGQCLCRRNFFGRRCNQCRKGFYDFPNCLECTCVAAGVKADGKEKDVCFPGPQGKCSCKENVEGDLCDRCKDLFFGLRISNLKGCLPCKCDVAGTLSGIAACDKETGQCRCKPNVDPKSRSCDTCKDGYYGLDASNIFGCKACDCNRGGSVSKNCEKKTGQCQCRPNITGRQCDRVLDDTFFLPTIRHLTYKAKDAKALNGQPLYTEHNSEFVAIAQHKVPIQWTINLHGKYIFVMNYKMEKSKQADVNISIHNEIYGSTLFKTTKNLLWKPGNKINENSRLFVLKENNKDFPVTLYGAVYNLRIYSSVPDLYVDYISLIPESHLNGEKLTSEIRVPCHVFGNTQPCIKYSYLSVPRNGVYTIEIEGTGRQEAEMLDRSYYPTLNINGAIMLRRDRPFTISFKQRTSDSFLLLLQFFMPNKANVEISVLIQGQDSTDQGKALLPNCPFSFACRNVLLDDNGLVKMFALRKDFTYTVTFLTQDVGVIALDLMALVPKNSWSFDFIRPTPFCVAMQDKCIRTKPIFPDSNPVILKAASSLRYVKPLFMPPNMINANRLPLHLKSAEEKSTTLIRWNTPNLRGYVYALVHYFQPFHPSTTAKVIINTLYSSVAGTIRFEFCPHVEGCRAAVTAEPPYSDRLAGLYLSGGNVGLTVSLPKRLHIWIDYLLFINPSDLNIDNILNGRQLQHSYNYREKCIRNYHQHPVMTKSCFNWLFQLVISFNNGPSPCKCDVRGSKSASCHLIGGQCQCKKHVTGRTCSTCAKEYAFYPRCSRLNRLPKYFI